CGWFRGSRRTVLDAPKQRWRASRAAPRRHRETIAAHEASPATMCPIGRSAIARSGATAAPHRGTGTTTAESCPPEHGHFAPLDEQYQTIAVPRPAVTHASYSL